MDVKDIIHYVENYANWYADRDKIETLIVLDIFPLNDGYMLKESKRYIRYKKDCIIIYNQDNNIFNIKYIDKYVIMKEKEAENGTMSLEIHNKDKQIGTCDLKYDSTRRKFENL